MMKRERKWICDFSAQFKRALQRQMLVSMAILLAMVFSPATNAELYNITILGEVEFNQVNSGALGNVMAGDTAVIELQVDATNFVDSANFPTRGYVIETFQLSFLAAAIVELQNPFPPGQTPYFVLRDNDPAVDGFFVSRSIEVPIGVPLNQTGIFGQFVNDFSVTYGGAELDSLSIEDAAGNYDFTGLSVFNWTINDGAFNPVGMIFSEMIISSAGDLPCKFPLGDVNQDGAIDLLDVPAFIDAFFGPIFVCEADINQDSVLDLLDVAPFVDILAGN